MPPDPTGELKLSAAGPSGGPKLLPPALAGGPKLLPPAPLGALAVAAGPSGGAQAECCGPQRGPQTVAVGPCGGAQAECCRPQRGAQTVAAGPGGGPQAVAAGPAGGPSCCRRPQRGGSSWMLQAQAGAPSCCLRPLRWIPPRRPRERWLGRSERLEKNKKAPSAGFLLSSGRRWCTQVICLFQDIYPWRAAGVIYGDGASRSRRLCIAKSRASFAAFVMSSKVGGLLNAAGVLTLSPFARKVLPSDGSGIQHSCHSNPLVVIHCSMTLP